MRLPPKIIHQGERPSYWKEMVLDCCKNLHIPKRERNLLHYYCDQINNFRPSLREIERNTNVRANQVSEVRKKLVQKGIIGYGSGMVMVDWYRIRNFAMIPPLDKEDTMKGFRPVKIPEPRLKDIRIKDHDAIDWRLLGRESVKRKYTPQELSWIHTIENMTETEYLETLGLIENLFCE